MLGYNGCLVSWHCKGTLVLLIGLDAVLMVSVSMMFVDDCIGSRKDCYADNCFFFSDLGVFCCWS